MFQKKVVFFFGRSNPPTRGHEKAFETVIDTAKKEGAQPLIFLSHTQNEKNPLPYSLKAKLMEKWYGNAFYEDTHKEFITPFHVCKKLSEAGVEHVTMVVGEDRAEGFKHSIGRYVGPDKDYKFTFRVISGQRTAGVSGTALRQFAKDNDFESFAKNVISKATPQQTKEIFDVCRQMLTESSIPVVGDIAKTSKIPYGLLKKIFDRQIGGKKSFKSLTSKEVRAAMKRVLSYARGGKFRSVDGDLTKTYRKKSKISKRKKHA